MSDPLQYFIDLGFDIALRRHPFQNIEWPKGVNGFASEFHQLKEKMPANLRKKCEISIMGKVEYCFRNAFRVFDQENFNRQYFSALTTVSEEYSKYADSVLGEHDFSKSISMYGNPFKKSVVISSKIVEFFPMAEATRKKPLKGFTTFNVPFLEENSLFVGYEPGTWRSSVSFAMGFSKLWVMFDIGCFFGLGQSHFDSVVAETRTIIENGHKYRITNHIDYGADGLANSSNAALGMIAFISNHVRETLFK